MLKIMREFYCLVSDRDSGKEGRSTFLITRFLEHNKVSKVIK